MFTTGVCTQAKRAAGEHYEYRYLGAACDISRCTSNFKKNGIYDCD